MSEKHKRYSRQRGKKPNVCSGKKKAKGTTGLMLYLNKEGPLNKLLKGRHTASPLSQQHLWRKGLHPQSRSVPSLLFPRGRGKKGRTIHQNGKNKISLPGSLQLPNVNHHQIWLPLSSTNPS